MSREDGADDFNGLGATVGTRDGVCAVVLLAGCPQIRQLRRQGPPAQATAPPIATSAASAKAGQAPQLDDAQPGTTTTQPADNAKVQQPHQRAEQTYRSGVDNYRAGHSDAARVDFDTAVDLMLTSGMDLKADPQLADEFDHLLNAVNSLEMAALKQGNGFSPVIEAAPLDAANRGHLPFEPDSHRSGRG